jgi:hypothetical protein
VDVFISYKQDERDRMRALAEGLRALKVNVWFDEQLGPDKTFTDEIAAVIQNCKAQLVCWSPASARSDWVRGEAEIGRRRGVLVAVMIERCELPPPFNMHHAEDLSGWNGAADHPGWQRVVEAIGRKLQRPGLGELARLQASADAQAWKRWAETYHDDPWAEDAWTKAEDLEVSAVRARVARDRSNARRVPEVPEVPKEPPPIAKEASTIQAAPSRGQSTRSWKPVVLASVAVAVLIGLVLVWATVRPFRTSQESVSTGPTSPSQSSPIAAPAAAPPMSTQGQLEGARPPSNVAPPAAPRVPARPAPDSPAAALRALDEFTARDWAITSTDVLARRLLAGTRLISLEAAAAAGDARAQVVLGAAHAFGIGGASASDAEAYRLFRLAADQGHPRGLNALGSLYMRGRGVTKDEAEAVRLYQLAARQGFALAQGSLGMMYATGRGVTRDDTEAVRLLRLAANQGHAPSQDALGNMYRDGRGVAKDDSEAVRLYRLAADQGIASAQTNLGQMYETGRGIRKDSAEALRLYRLAAQQGSRRAKESLKRLEAAR